MFKYMIDDLIRTDILSDRFKRSADTMTEYFVRHCFDIFGCDIIPSVKSRENLGSLDERDRSTW